MATNFASETARPHSDPAVALFDQRDVFIGFLMKRLGNKTVAEDVLQDFCLRVLYNKDKVRDVDRLDAWLFAVLRSTLNDHFRKTGRKERLETAVAIDPTTPKTAPDAFDELGHICTCINALIPELRPGDADLIRQIDLEGRSRPEVAAELGLATGTLAVRLHRARAALRDRLLSHCGCCCEHGFEECHCPPAGCDGGGDHVNCSDNIDQDANNVG